MTSGPRLLLLSFLTFSLTANSEGVTMSSRAAGTFDVTVEPLGTPDKAEGATLGRMSLSKQLQGDLTGTSKGEMLTAMTDTKGSAGYVAIERVSGTLQGRPGTFVLQHIGTMTQGAQQMTIKVVPDSGTGQLTGLSGTMTITIVDGKHFYEFDYVLPPQK